MLQKQGSSFYTFKRKVPVTKISELRLLAAKSNAAVIAISESWLDQSVGDGEIYIDGYCLERKDRNRNGGGVCLYINNKLAYTRITDVTSEEDEMLFVNLYLPKCRPIIAGAIYRPPKQSNFIERLEDNLSNFRSDCETYILGDMNISYQQQCSLQESYKGLLRLFNLQQLINSPTRITPTSSTTIDHVLTNSKENIVQSGTIPCGLSDHLILHT